MSATQTSATASVRPDVTKMNAILVAAKTMATGGSGAFRLAVYSPTIMASSGILADAYNDVSSLWIDNAFDTIRSRGPAPASRRTILIAGSAPPA
jgi:hypothetical protein